MQWTIVTIITVIAVVTTVTVVITVVTTTVAGRGMQSTMGMQSTRGLGGKGMETTRGLGGKGMESTRGLGKGMGKGMDATMGDSGRLPPVGSRSRPRSRPPLVEPEPVCVFYCYVFEIGGWVEHFIRLLRTIRIYVT